MHLGISDLLGAASKNGRPNSAMGTCLDIDVCPDLILAGLAIAGAAAFFFLYQQITMAAAAQMPRKKKRSIGQMTSSPQDHVNLLSRFVEKFFAGML